MANIIINERNKTLEITKKFAAAASRFGSNEYMELKAARSEFPTFKVVTKTTSRKSKDSFKGLTYEFMENYIKSHKPELLETFYELRGLDADGKRVELAAAATYGEIKMWFLTQFPEIEKLGENGNKIIEEARKAREAQKKAA